MFEHYKTCTYGLDHTLLYSLISDNANIVDNPTTRFKTTNCVIPKYATENKFTNLPKIKNRITLDNWTKYTSNLLDTFNEVVRPISSSDDVKQCNINKYQLPIPTT